MEKKRSNNFSAIEINLLKDIVISKAHIIENKQSDANTWKAKKKCWEEISIEFNSRSLNSKSAETLRKKWDNMKKTVKDKVTGQRKYALGTGGGPPMTPPNLTKEEEGIFNVITIQATGTESICDSDYQPDTPVQASQSSTVILTDLTNNDIESIDFSKGTCLEDDVQELNKWSDYTPKSLRTKPSLVTETDDKENPFRRYRKRNYTGQLTNKAWTELANDKKHVCQLKNEHLRALIAESESRKRYYDLQNQLLEIKLAKEKKEDSHSEN